MKVRAKFTVTKIASIGSAGGPALMYRMDPITKESIPTGIPVKEITMSAVYDDGLSKENASFATHTPSGSITFTLNNPALAEAFELGKSYYVDFTPAEK